MLDIYNAAMAEISLCIALIFIKRENKEKYIKFLIGQDKIKNFKY